MTVQAAPEGTLFEREAVIGRPLAEVFAFFSNPANLAELTPPEMHFRMTDISTEAIGEGTRIDYALRVKLLPLKWTSLIQEWEPPFRFVDVQLSGPYKSWVHEHTFEDLGDETLVRDRVWYRVPGGALIDKLFVRRDIERIFAYRTKRLRELFGADGAAF